MNITLQVVAELTEAETLTSSISSISRAVIKSVSEVLDLPPGHVTGDVAMGSGRFLLSSVSMLFTLSVDSDMTDAATSRQLQHSISSGTFLYSLSNKLSSLVTRVTSITVSDAPPQSNRVETAGLHSNLEGTSSTLLIYHTADMLLMTIVQCPQNRIHPHQASSMGTSLSVLLQHY